MEDGNESIANEEREERVDRLLRRLPLVVPEETPDREREIYAHYYREHPGEPYEDHWFISGRVADDRLFCYTIDKGNDLLYRGGKWCKDDPFTLFYNEIMEESPWTPRPAYRVDLIRVSEKLRGRWYPEKKPTKLSDS